MIRAYTEQDYLQRIEEVNPKHKLITVYIHPIKHHTIGIFICGECGNYFEARYMRLNIHCNNCREIRPLTLDDCHNTAKERNFKLLSKIYENSHAKMTWQCPNGHVWKASMHLIKAGNGCPYCVGKNKTIEDCRKLALSRGFRCLSNKYHNSKKKLLWQCSKGHEWYASWNHISRGIGCPYCSGRITTLEDCRELGEFYGLELLTSQYFHYRQKLQWKCKKHNFVFEKSRRDILRTKENSCSICSERRHLTSANENRTKELIDKYLSAIKENFYIKPNDRSILKNQGSQNGNLEIDIAIYDKYDQLQLCIEWNGIYWHSRPTTQLHDEIKKNYFSANNIPFLQILDPTASDKSFVIKTFEEIIKPRLDKLIHS